MVHGVGPGLLNRPRKTYRTEAGMRDDKGAEHPSVGQATKITDVRALWHCDVVGGNGRPPAFETFVLGKDCRVEVNCWDFGCHFTP